MNAYMLMLRTTALRQIVASKRSSPPIAGITAFLFRLHGRSILASNLSQLHFLLFGMSATFICTSLLLLYFHVKHFEQYKRVFEIQPICCFWRVFKTCVCTQDFLGKCNASLSRKNQHLTQLQRNSRFRISLQIIDMELWRPGYVG